MFEFRPNTKGGRMAEERCMLSIGKTRQSLEQQSKMGSFALVVSVIRSNSEGSVILGEGDALIVFKRAACGPRVVTR